MDRGKTLGKWEWKMGMENGSCSALIDSSAVLVASGESGASLYLDIL